jgi:hypothetical protein
VPLRATAMRDTTVICTEDNALFKHLACHLHPSRSSTRLLSYPASLSFSMLRMQPSCG